MNYYVYKITNIETGHFYIGKRTCKCSIENDFYFGSGSKIKEEIEKHGIDKFKKTILAICHDPYELSNIESIYIKNHIEDVLCLNVSKGHEKVLLFKESLVKEENSLKEWQDYLSQLEKYLDEKQKKIEIKEKAIIKLYKKQNRRKELKVLI